MITLRALLGVVIAGVLTMNSGAQSSDNANSAPVVRLWDVVAPGALGDSENDVPSLEVYLVDDTTTRAGMVVFPGGGYHTLAPHESKIYAQWLNLQGINAFVVKYRLGSHGYRHPVMLQDAARAVRLVRSRATEWRVDPNRIGAMGSSAGGHLVSALLTGYDGGDSKSDDPIEKQSSRPDLGILCYPVINFSDIGHAGVRGHLLGEVPTAELIAEVSTEEHVTSSTPPTLLFHTSDDSVVQVEHSLRFATALGRAGVPFALHVYPHGKHGLGIGTREWSPDAEFHPWTTQCILWLKDHGFIDP